MTPDEGPL